MSAFYETLAITFRVGISPGKHKLLGRSDIITNAELVFTLIDGINTVEGDVLFTYQLIALTNVCLKNGLY